MRNIVWFSCGAASACTAKHAVELKLPDLHIVCCDTRPSENDDNYRFSKECEEWFQHPLTYIRNDKYRTVDDVFEKTRYMSGVNGARCTTELKKIPRHRFALPDDIHLFGFTANEKRRIREFEEKNPELQLRWLLREIGMTKVDCYWMLKQAGIALPVMYRLGFDNNNCPGCVKASSPWYWSMVRKHFPEVFKRRCEQSRKLGVRLVEIKHHVRIFLDELPEIDFPKPKRLLKMSCGPECGGPSTS